MTELRGLCHALLNGPVDSAAVAVAEARLDAVLAETGTMDADAPLGRPWVCADLPGPGAAVARKRALRQLAPTLLLAGVWLARVAQPATAHRPSECHLFDLYCRMVGLDDPASAPPLRFRAGLVMAGIDWPPLESPGCFDAAEDFALAVPLAHLALMHRPRRFFPELLGYTLAHVWREPAWWDAEDAGPRETNRALALAAWTAYPGREAEAGRISAGWNLYRRGFDKLVLDIGQSLARQRTAEQAMADLLRTKRDHAIGYHGRIQLGNRGLDQWLSDGDPAALLGALRDSTYVDRTCPAASRLIRAIDFGGPMFGVFTAEERKTCLDWIANPSNPVESMGRASHASVPRPMPDARPVALPKRDRRGLFTALLHAESTADCPPEADAAIRRVFRRTCGFAPLQRGYRRYFPYEPARFQAHVEAMHRHEVGRYRPSSGPPAISREYCRWAALQLAPAILTDGCWLAGIGGAAESLGGIGRHLLKIYADELGEGRPGWNHPNVYRRLLESLGVDLPPFDSAAFARSPLFLDAAFDIPVYLLTMGLRTERYFPELLGLNLAIELSGLGAGYMRVVDVLRHHRIDPAIIQLHLGIDNLASGHAARAREAIALSLEETRRRGGAEAQQAQWRRIWTGYLSLHMAARGLVPGFLGRYLRERGRALNPLSVPP